LPVATLELKRGVEVQQVPEESQERRALNRESRRQPGVVVSVKERASKASVVEGQTSREEQG